MAHHFDTELARKDTRLNICDFYLFAGRPGFTTMVMTTNGDVGFSSPDVYHPEGIYAFRFDRTGTNEEDLVFKVRFDAPEHVDGDEHRHVQSFSVTRGEGADVRGLGGKVLITGKTNAVSESNGVRAFAGIVPELWAADALGFREIIRALREEDRFQNGFVGGRNWFHRRNVMAIVVEVPNALIGDTRVFAWTTVSLMGHAPEVQIARLGYPLFTFLLLAERPDLYEVYHGGHPKDDRATFGSTVEALAEHLSSRADAGHQSAAHATVVAARFLPSMIPFALDEPASFSVVRINGRPLAEHALDVMWTLVAGTRISDGNTPPRERLVPEFPYYGRPFTAEEQAGLTPLTGVTAY